MDRDGAVLYWSAVIKAASQAHRRPDGREGISDEEAVARRNDGPHRTDGVRRTPAEWEALEGVVVLDPDGWRLDDKDWNEPIGFADWERRVSVSTISPAWTRCRHCGRRVHAVDHGPCPSHLLFGDDGWPDGRDAFI